METTPDQAKAELFQIVKNHCQTWSETETGWDVTLDDDAVIGQFLNDIPTWVATNQNPDAPRELELVIDSEKYYRFK